MLDAKSRQTKTPWFAKKPVTNCQIKPQTTVKRAKFGFTYNIRTQSMEANLIYFSTLYQYVPTG
jgi:hypothetical protein